jgi:hypothetical protein
MSALAISDLREIDGEARVRDLDLGMRLGFGRPEDIRKLIKRNLTELARYGFNATVSQNHSGGRGRPTQEYLLNEPQAVLICMKSDTDAAADVREQVIRVFMAHRREGLRHDGANPSPDQSSLRDEATVKLEHLARREEGIQAGVAISFALHNLLERGAGMAHLPIWNIGKRPKWWFDIEVRGMVGALHRQCTIDRALALIEARVGEERAPTRSSMGRFWQRLDVLFAPSQTIGVDRHALKGRVH